MLKTPPTPDVVVTGGSPADASAPFGVASITTPDGPSSCGSCVIPVATVIGSAVIVCAAHALVSIAATARSPATTETTAVSGARGTSVLGNVPAPVAVALITTVPVAFAATPAVTVPEAVASVPTTVTSAFG